MVDLHMVSSELCWLLIAVPLLRGTDGAEHIT